MRRQVSSGLLVVSARRLRHEQRRLFTTVLGIETSCDDTSASILQIDSERPPRIIALHTERALDIHEKFGGIHPMHAVNTHHSKLGQLLENLRKQYYHEFRAIDLVCATRGPGMNACLGVGLEVAKGLSIGLDKPLIGVHHMQAHALTPRMLSADTSPSFPYYSLLVSGGHTMLVASHSLIKHEVLVNTMDIAVGDFLDKCARDLGVLWNGKMPAAAMEEWSADHVEASDQSFGLPQPMTNSIEQRNLKAFSFSGLGSAFNRIVASEKPNERSKKKLAVSVQKIAFDHIIEKTIQAISEQSLNATALVLSGGVACNSILRSRYFTQILLR